MDRKSYSKAKVSPEELKKIVHSFILNPTRSKNSFEYWFKPKVSFIRIQKKIVAIFNFCGSIPG